MEIIKRRENETDFEYGLRLIEYKVENNPTDLDWQDIIDILGLSYHRDTLRKSSQSQFGGYNVYKYMKEKLEENITDNNIINKIKLEKQELQKERYKIQTEKIELNAWLREQARLELFEEKVVNAIRNLPSIEIPKYKIEYKNNELDTIIGYADTHVGKEIVIKGLKGEILNEYNQEIFEKRMWDLLNKIVTNLERDQLKHVNLIDGGDCIEGILHLSQLKSLRMGVIESIIYYSTFLREWLNELSKYVAVDFYTSSGNHSDLRLLTGKKGDFPHENVEMVIPWFLKETLSHNKNIKLHDNLNGLNYFNVVGFDILSTHGQNEKDLENSLKDYSNMYGVNIDYFITAHKHTKFEKTVGFNKDIIQLPSIVGVDEFSAQIKKVSNPGAKMMVLERNYGSVVDYNIKLQ